MRCGYAVLDSLRWGLMAGGVMWLVIAVFGSQRPAKIAGFHNRRMRRLALGAAFGVFLGVFWGTMWSDGCLPELLKSTLLASVVSLGIVSLSALWSFYWGIPYFRRKTGNRVVDEAVERYRKPGEKAYVGLPRVVDVDGRRYVMAVYHQGAEVAAMLAFREDTGEVVQDPGLMERLARCARVGDEMAGFPVLYQRLSNYKNAQKALRAWPQALEEVRGLVKALEGTPYEGEARALLVGWEIGEEYTRRLMAMWEEEGAWAAAHGWEHMKEVRCEELEPLDARLRGAYLYFREHLQEMERAMAARERLAQAWAAQALPLEGESRKAFWNVLGLMGPMEERVRFWEAWPKEKPFRRFLWTEEQRRQWAERLAWGAGRRVEEVRAQVRKRKAVRLMAWVGVVVGVPLALLSLVGGPWWGGVLLGGVPALLGWRFRNWEPKGK